MNASCVAWRRGPRLRGRDKSLALLAGLWRSFGIWAPVGLILS